MDDSPPIPESHDFVNVSKYLKKMAQMMPYKRAVVCPMDVDALGRVTYSHLTFQQLDRESDCLAHGLQSVGITRGTRTILMVKPSIDFFSLTYALLKTGAVPVIVDPGMGVDRMVRCLEESKPQAFIGIPKAHLMRIIYRKFFKTVNTWITVGKPSFWGSYNLRELIRTPWKPYPIMDTRRHEMAAILFTSGSTGPAKGAVYTHGMFDAQVRYIGSHFNITPGEIDLPTFPLFSLFDPALGMTAIIPDMDPTRPAHVVPEKIFEAVFNHGVTNMFASPALLNRVGAYGKERGIKLPSLKRVVSAGAPVSPKIIEAFATMLSEDAEIHTPYGATEAMPVLSIDSSEILNETRKHSEKGFGTCVGYPVGDIDIRIIQITDEPISEWRDELEVPDGEIGEITVKGEVVSREYYDRPKSTAFAKIQDGDEIWHRMGDLGWRDNKDRIWFCGRKSQRVVMENRTLYTIPCESIFNNHAAVSRSALIGVGSPKKPIICIELLPELKQADRDEIEKDLLEMAKSNELTKHIQTVMFVEDFPVDVRHNSKIFREKLAETVKS